MCTFYFKRRLGIYNETTNYKCKIISSQGLGQIKISKTMESETRSYVINLVRLNCPIRTNYYVIKCSDWLFFSSTSSNSCSEF